ncbi:MAG: heavy metal-binding domain-containing protein [Kordiimonadaceae bacterium]|nr:heavy metal-binding domain-containing protein [Kordiimonadaceae bacterium]
MDSFFDQFDEFDKALSEMPEVLQFFFGGNFYDFVAGNIYQAIGIGGLGWLIATLYERRHNRQMGEREALLSDIKLSTTKNIGKNAASGVMICGSVVVAHDFFRTLIIQFRKIIGGNIKAYERLVVRGRREALIRLREDARLRGFDRVVNIRYGSSRITGMFITAIEMVAYGTGIKDHPKTENSPKS